ncbi:MAG TPA: alpha/beta hydrolase [Candidatus Sulfotelmatobacter sp.]|nr:alpha/beta hydrolase [Candidatus Sulfotelmatobacter sp.]
MPEREPFDRLSAADGATIAYHRVPGKSPGVVFCGGFKSDMTGTKATALDAHCREAGRACLRFDYFAHGASSGSFLEATVGRWAEDTIQVIDRLTQGPLVLVGSSMGGWLMLLAALARPERVAGLVGVAPAADFTQALMEPSLPAEATAALARDGVWHRPSQYSADPYPITRRLIEEGRRHLLLDRPIPFRGPVRLLHGMRDPDVPWRHSLKLIAALESRDVTLTLVKDGDHRLSEPADIARLIETVETLCRQVA